MENPGMRIDPLEDGDQENQSSFTGLSKGATMKRARFGKQNCYLIRSVPKISFFPRF